ncbi:flagellar assembly protein A [Sulfurimonas sp. C5]|uniref:flagellar assembly protein A n=1 Tax=Sulfurimonas sp. C5 TaxID=3036947 RepID=UPI0024568D95|nr:flagellar assembly protein A [Sulfurimonas sp. C5]MDH4944479.1 FapA family protein [Sulfurimonas sp. C5]
MISFAPITKKTVSIPKTLGNVAKEKNISIKSIDFTLETYETCIRRKGLEKDIVLEDTSNLDEEMLFDKNVRIYQRYDIKISPSDLDTSTYKISLAANKQKTKVIAVIKAGSVFAKDDNLAQKLLNEIWHKKLSAGFLVGVFETGLQKQLEKLSQILPYGKKLPKDVKFTVATSLDPISPNNGKLEKLYLREDEEKNYIDGVKKGEIILRYTKPKNGRGGRSCEGIYIPEGQAEDFTIPEVDETIVLKENKDYIEFYANDNGFVEYTNDSLKISKTIQLEGACQKTTGNLDAKDLNNEISVDIKHNREAYDDAIGAGLKVDVKDLNVNGSIGANVNISAQSINIDAQTHQKTTLSVSDKANIKLHRGDLMTDHAEIETVETGRIKANKSIHVKKVIGGELIAPKIYIDELVSNAKVIASELIEIKSIRGSNNTLIINPDKIDAYHKEKEHLEDEIRKHKEEYDEEVAFIKSKTKEHSEQIDRIKTFQKRILAAQAAGKAPTKQDMIRVREYKRKAQELQDRQDGLKYKDQAIAELKRELDRLLEQDLHAQIRTNSLYDGHTKVIFVDPQYGEEIVYMPQGKVEVISLGLDKKENRIIKT